MTSLTLTTPHALGSCGCLLETGDRHQPLFVPCNQHAAPVPEPQLWWVEITHRRDPGARKSRVFLYAVLARTEQEACALGREEHTSNLDTEDRKITRVEAQLNAGPTIRIGLRLEG